MYDLLLRHVAQYVSLSEGEQQAFCNALKRVKLRRHQYLLQEGTVCRHDYFVIKGGVRQYEVDKKGQEMTTQVGLPGFVAGLAITVECAGTLMLLAGAGTRLAALGIFALFVGMIGTWHHRHGFFMNWFGQLPAGKEGFEYHLLALGLCAALFLEGGGRWSVDQWLSAQ